MSRVFFIPVQSANRRFIGPGGEGGGGIGETWDKAIFTSYILHRVPVIQVLCFAENSPDVPALLVPRQKKTSDRTVNPLPAPGRSQWQVMLIQDTSGEHRWNQYGTLMANLPRRNPMHLCREGRGGGGMRERERCKEERLCVCIHRYQDFPLHTPLLRYGSSGYLGA